MVLDVESEDSVLDPAMVTKIESIVQARMEESQAPGMAVCVVKDGQIAYS